jgi:hypothetical protein
MVAHNSSCYNIRLLTRNREAKMADDDFRQTGIWPFSLFPAGWGSKLRTGPENAAPQAKVFDPVALAWKAGPKLIEAGWVGIKIMPHSFLWQVVDAAPADVSSLVEKWAGEQRSAIADMFTERLATYTVDELAKTAMQQAIDAYRREHFLSTVRTLMPEIERFGRMVALHDGTLPKNQKEAIEAIKDYVGHVPVSNFDPIESLSIYPVLADDLFATCFTTADASQLGAGPNRHAELHGLASYGDLRGATKMLCVADFLLCSVTAATVSKTDPAA